jgi:F-type H+-transporting ATPase subunit b
MNLRRFAPFALSCALLLGLASAGSGLRAQAPQPVVAVQAQAPAEAPEPRAEEAEGHHQPAVSLFGHSMGPLGQFWITAFNFVLFAGLLIYLLKGTLAAAFKARTLDLETRLSQAEREKAEAEQQIQALEARMAGLRQELEGIMAKADADAETEKRLILESAKAEAAQILLQTRAEIASQQRQAEAELRTLLAGLVVAGAAQRLETQVRGDVAARVLDRAIDQVGGAK